MGKCRSLNWKGFALLCRQQKDVIIPLYLLAVPNSYNEKSILSEKKPQTHNSLLPATKVSSECRALHCLLKAKGLTLSPSSLFFKLVRAHRGSEQRGYKSRNLISAEVSNGKDAPVAGCIHTADCM